jgi:ribosome-binding protein aMBF1 (putative translation factor)
MQAKKTDFKDRLKQARSNKGLSQNELATLI